MSSAILTGNLPTEVPPNFCTTQLPPPGMLFSCTCGLRSPSMPLRKLVPSRGGEFRPRIRGKSMMCGVCGGVCVLCAWMYWKAGSMVR